MLLHGVLMTSAWLLHLDSGWLSWRHDDLSPAVGQHRRIVAIVFFDIIIINVATAVGRHYHHGYRSNCCHKNQLFFQLHVCFFNSFYFVKFWTLSLFESLKKAYQYSTHLRSLTMPPKLRDFYQLSVWTANRVSFQFESRSIFFIEFACALQWLIFLEGSLRVYLSNLHLYPTDTIRLRRIKQDISV